jgi:hypothetical protein
MPDTRGVLVLHMESAIALFIELYNAITTVTHKHSSTITQQSSINADQRLDSMYI